MRMHEDNDDINEPMDDGEEEQEFELEAIDHDDETKRNNSVAGESDKKVPMNQ